MQANLPDTKRNAPFDPIPVLNKVFRSPASLEQVPRTQAYVALCEDYLALKLANCQSQSASVETAKSSALDAPSALQKLTKDVKDMQALGQSTRQEVHTMTSDIQRLDRTKDNLVQSITMLKRLQMLSKLQLEVEHLLKVRKYADLACTVTAAAELAEYFRPFRSVPQVAQLTKRMSDLEQRIFQQVEHDVKQTVAGGAPSHGQLSMACKALDCLNSGANYREQLTGWYCSQCLMDYNNIFRIGDEASSLENISRRYAFLRKIIQRHKDCDRIFPSDWKVENALVRAACEKTKSDITTLTAQFRDGATNFDRVQILLRALNETNEFENFVVKITGDKSVRSSISTAFMPHLSLWVDYQDRQLAQRVNGYPRTVVQAAVDSESDVIPSSADLFIAYRQALAQMNKLSNGEALLQLSDIFAKRISEYCRNVLQNQLQTRPTKASEESSVGLVLKTANYCIATIDQLEENIQEQIEPRFREDVSFENQRDRFLGLVNQCLDSFVNYVDYTLDPSWKEMANLNWVRIGNVGDQSSYVSHLCMTIRTSTEECLGQITKFTHARLVCDRIVEMVSLAFLSTAAKARPIPEVAAEQMLLDLYVVKNTLSSLLSLSALAIDKVGRLENYSTNVAKLVGKVEAVFKVLITRTDQPDMLVQNYLLLVRDKSAANFRKILEIKGVRNPTRFIDLFRSMAADSDLIGESPLLSQVSLARHSRQHLSPTPAQTFFDKEQGGSVFKFNENFRKIGDLLRRDSPQNSLQR